MTLTEALNHFTELGAEWVLWLLIFLSVVSIAIMVERAIVFWKRRGDPGALSREAEGLLRDGKADELRTRLAGRRSVEAAVLLEGLRQMEGGAAAAEEAMAGAMVRERLSLERYLAFLGTVGSNAPFIGLAGTVIGIMEAFRSLGGNLQAGAGETVMAAIAEALVATLVGLVVAVPAVVAFNYLQRRVKTTMQQTLAVTHTLLAHLKARATPDGKE